MFQSINQNIDFKNKYPLETRKKESQRVLLKYPERIPIICQEFNEANNLFFLSSFMNTKERKKSNQNKNQNHNEISQKEVKIKYLVPNDLTLGQFVYVLRKRLNLNPQMAMTLFINKKLIANSQLLTHIYTTNVDDDGFLYIYFKFENTFG